MKNRVLKISNLSKKFTLDEGHVNAPSFFDIIKSFFGYKFNTGEDLNDFWALKNVSFELKRGDNLGIVGLNGAGKSTLLKIMLNRLTAERGTVEINGTVGGLIELGAGFHPEQTGRKNIVLNARMLGISPIEIEAKMSEIIGFAELGSFIDMPVKTYSSGMSIRLGFSIAIHFVNDLIICDEILAVGDFEFKQKCYRKIHELKKNKSFILVSHGVGDIALFCDKAMLLHKGEVISYGNVSEVLEHYAKASHDLSVKDYLDSLREDEKKENTIDTKKQYGRNILKSRFFSESEEFRISKFGPIYHGNDGIRNLTVHSSKELVSGEMFIEPNESLDITVEFDNESDLASLRVGLPFFSESGVMVIGPDSRSLVPKSQKCISKGRKKFKFKFDTPPLLQGRYLVALAINNDPGFLYRNHLVWVNFRNVTGAFGQSRVAFTVNLE